MTSSDIIQYKVSGFNNPKYIQNQKKKILERIDRFKDGKLYFEIGGKFLYDAHAARVLPGFDPVTKVTILKELHGFLDIFYCVKAEDIANDRQMRSDRESYTDYCSRAIKELESTFDIKPKIVINLCDRINHDQEVQGFEESLSSQGYTVKRRYKIEGYPDSTDAVLSDTGYGADDYVESNKNLILVTGAGSNSGKMSTCLGQIYLDKQHGLISGYAKYETFPIWILPLNHPINLAYEAATADIGDYNVIDTYHMEAYGKNSVNYNRDVDAFKIILSMKDKLLDSTSFMNEYKSPTDMGINFAGHAIENDEVVCIASLHEIRRRKEWYAQIIARGAGDQEWYRKCELLEDRALKYINERGYNPDLALE
ncbi:MAG: DUF1846 family protein [Candidatus Dojkabacteria bacterium]|nr:MAG: DUF1846 family protein [Candidatus Dojkabacteria bacterium]